MNKRSVLDAAALAIVAALAGCSGSGEQSSKERVVDLGGGDKMAFVLIPPGSFTMGTTEAQVKAALARWPEKKEDAFAGEKPTRKVTLSKALWMGQHEVTVGQFRRFVEATGHKTDAERGTKFQGAFVVYGEVDRDVGGAIAVRRSHVGMKDDATWRNPYFKQTDEHPVVCVSWNDARAFADWLNATDRARPAGSSYRLPTEAEWEYACRAGTTTWYQWGDDPGAGKGWCNVKDLAAEVIFGSRGGKVFQWDDGFVYTAPVGSFRASSFGLHDMHGNVGEWCEDWHGAYRSGDQTDPVGPASGEKRVLRGGSWLDLPDSMRSTHRSPDGPHCRDNYNGFRLVLATGHD